MPTPRPPGVRCADVNEEQFVLAHNSLPKLLLEILVVVGFRSARIALALLNQIALASEPAQILAAGSLYRLGQLLRQEPLGAILSMAFVVMIGRHPWRPKL